MFYRNFPDFLVIQKKKSILFTDLLIILTCKLAGNLTLSIYASVDYDNWLVFIKDFVSLGGNKVELDSIIIEAWHFLDSIIFIFYPTLLE